MKIQPGGSPLNAITKYPYFDYLPLPPGSIRLIKLLPSPCYHSPLKIELRVVSLDDKIKFDALSYTWGPPTVEEQLAAAMQNFTTVERCFPVFCGGHILLATRNLRDALRRLRVMCRPGLWPPLAWPRGTQEYIWVDALCIDQANLEERSQQVNLMGETFRNATTVFAWLGELDETSYEALRMMQLLLDMACYKWQSSAAFMILDPALYKKAGASVPSPKQWLDLVIFMSRGWFQRTWVIQEVALAGPRNVFCLVGAIGFDLQDVLGSLKSATRLGWPNIKGYIMTEYTTPDSINIHLKQLHWLLADMRHMFLEFPPIWDVQQHKTRPSFYSCRELFWHSQCIDPRDKIFGASSVVAELDPDGDDPFTVDYQSSSYRVYVYATKRIIRKSESLDLLTMPKVDGMNEIELQSLPSWCPNYTLLGPWPSHLLGIQEQNGRSSWSACASSLYLSSHKSLEDHLLVLHGVCYDKLSHSCPTGDWMQDMSDFTNIVSFLQHPQLSSGSRTYSWLTTIVCGNYDPEDSSDVNDCWPLSKTEFFRIALGAIIRAYIQMYPSENIANLLGLLDQEVEKLQILDLQAANVWPDFDKVYRKHCSIPGLTLEDAWKFYYGDSSGETLSMLIHDIRKKCHTRKLFIHEKGGLGLGPPDLQVGDEIWLLAGCSMPMILRPMPNKHYTMIGEAFISGIMHGEAWPSDTSRLTTLVLE